MNRRSKLSLSILIVFTVLIVSIYGARVVLAQEGYQISWWTVDGGGGVSSAEGYALRGTIGQHDAGKLGSGEYTILGGFWVRGILESVIEYIINLPLVIR